MAVSVRQLFDVINITNINTVSWGTSFTAPSGGVYIISLNPDIDDTNNYNHQFQLDNSVVTNWIQRATNLTINGSTVSTTQQVQNYLRSFWKPDENILYIGESSSNTTTLSKRVNDFYTHEVGNNGPHHGGFWLKLISQLQHCYVHYANCNTPREAEFKMLLKFTETHTNLSYSNIPSISDS